jgi:hypothetical protein
MFWGLKPLPNSARNCLDSCRDNFISVLAALGAEHVLANSSADGPVEQDEFSVHSASYTLARSLNQSTQFIEERRCRLEPVCDSGGPFIPWRPACNASAHFRTPDPIFASRRRVLTLGILR